MLALFGFLCTQVHQLTTADVLTPYPPLCSNVVRVDGPGAVDKTVGTITVYCFMGDWDRTVARIRNRIAQQKDFTEFKGFSGMRWFWNSTDLSFHWNERENMPAIGLMRDFRADKQRLAHPFAPRIKGRKLKGYITILSFDGTIRVSDQARANREIRM